MAEVVKKEIQRSGIEGKHLTFLTDGQKFAIPVGDVVGIEGLKEITKIPEFPDYAKGVINSRGVITPVIDMRTRLQKPEVPYTERTCIIITIVESTNIGFLVDSVEEVCEVSHLKITKAPKVGDGINRYLKGIGHTEDEIVLFLDVQKLISDEELYSIREELEEI